LDVDHKVVEAASRLIHGALENIPGSIAADEVQHAGFDDEQREILGGLLREINVRDLWDAVRLAAARLPGSDRRQDEIDVENVLDLDEGEN
jgi:hypothetical protein